MDELAKFQFQLAQVQERRKQKPDDRTLMQLEEKLKKMINLSNQLDKASRSTIPLKAATKDNDATPLSLPLAQGTRCEARLEGHQWFEAVIQSVNEDASTYTVIFAGTAEAFHCPPSDVRPFRPGITKRKLAATQIPIQDKKKSEEQRTPAVIGNTLKRTKHTKEEHIQKKEAEHREKQQVWKKFSQKYGITKKPL